MTELSAEYVLEYAYRRTTGPVIGRFLTGLRDGHIEGIRTRAGRVIVPPLEYDPETGDALDDWVPLSDQGAVQSWAWVSDPLRLHPLQRPFAWALIRLDGADTAMLHAVDTGGKDTLESGTRVRARWAEERVGSVRDILCFEVVS